MKINPIYASSEFKYKYVEVNSSIYSLDSASKVFPKNVEEIKNSFCAMQPNCLFLKKFVYPSYEQMIKEINERIHKILAGLNITRNSSALIDFENAYKAYDYLVNHLKYNMLTMEERGNLFEDNTIYLYCLKKNKNKLKELNLKPATPAERSFYRTKKLNMYNEIAKIDESLKKTLDKNEASYIKGLYNVFVREEAVCSDFTNAYNFLLEKIGITCYKVISERKYKVITEGKETDASGYHAYSLVEFERGSQKDYYACDLTESIINKDKYNSLKGKGITLGFGMGKSDIISDDHQILSIQKQEGINEGKFYPEIEENIIEKSLPQDLIVKIAAFSEEKETM